MHSRARWDKTDTPFHDSIRLNQYNQLHSGAGQIESSNLALSFGIGQPLGFGSVSLGCARSGWARSKLGCRVPLAVIDWQREWQCPIVSVHCRSRLSRTEPVG